MSRQEYPLATRTPKLLSFHQFLQSDYCAIRSPRRTSFATTTKLPEDKFYIDASFLIVPSATGFLRGGYAQAVTIQKAIRGRLLTTLPTQWFDHEKLAKFPTVNGDFSRFFSFSPSRCWQVANCAKILHFKLHFNDPPC